MEAQDGAPDVRPANESVVTGILETLQFNAMVVINGGEVTVRFDAASWGDAVDVLHNQYGSDSQWVLNADDAAAQTG